MTAISWLYLAVSLVLAIPATGYLVGTMSGHLDMLGATLACGALAAGTKLVGDLIAVGDPRGRAAHGGLCVMVAGAAGSAVVTLLLIALCVPFWSRRGQAHFGASPRD